jgi:rare lipoprotein A (peptidoglycan hydrolase)
MEGQRREDEGEREVGREGRQVGGEGELRVRQQRLVLCALGIAVWGCTFHHREPAPSAPPAPSPPQVGVASWYGGEFHGNRTASGDRFNQHAMTAAHRSLPLGTPVRVTNLENGRSVVVRVTDRGPFVHGRVIDVSQAAARSLGMVRSGTARVRVVALGPGSGQIVPVDARLARRAHRAQRRSPRRRAIRPRTTQATR